MSGPTVVADLVAAATAHAGRVAVESPDAPPLTYGALLARARALAASLRAEGIGRGDLVALDLGKSAAHVVALLAVWLAGAAFLPLDPTLPPDRRRLVLDLARPRRILSAPLPEPEPEPEPVPAPAPDPEDLAYVVFTSGSTGAPKGVLVPHRGLPNLLRAQISAFGLSAGCRSLFYLSTAFDASISDLGTALLSGATLVVEPPERLASAAGLLAVLAERAITHADLPPSLLPAIDPRRLPASLSTVVIGGEPCPPEAVRRWAERVRVVNVYGPTEATVCSSLGACDPRTWTRPLLGRPLPGVIYRIVDEHLAPVPDGTPGELVIGGVGLALGYLGRPDLTAARFVEIAGDRVYRTGDRVVRREDGEVEFLGRLDRQVKLRGRRIELEEIEARLAEHAAVESAAVVKTRAASGLVAFVVPRAPAAVDLEPSLRSHLAAALPAWMIPARIRFIPALPRTPSGKVDLTALESRHPHRDREGAEVRPRTERRCSPEPPLPRGRGAVASARWTSAAAAVLEALWCDVLGVSAVEADDDFAALGGDSVALVEMAARAEAAGLPFASEHSPGARLTFGELLGRAERGGAGEGDRRTAAFLRRDVEPDLAEIRREAARPRGSAGAATGAVLITGAAGALGSLVLAELLAGGAALVAVVRARDEAGAALRIAGAPGLAGRAGELREALRDGRLRVLAGDLSRPRFGLDEEAWSRLSREVAAIVHAAARVDGVSPYEALRGAGVEATREVLRLAASGRSKHLHHVSTLSVLSQSEREAGPLDERAGLEATRAVLGGYAQSKWAAEHLVRASGLPATVFRLGLLAPSEHLTRFFRGLRDLGGAPFPRRSLELDATPARGAASAIARHASSSAPEAGATIHLANPAPATLLDLLDAARAAGAAVADVPCEAWPAHARSRLASPDAAVAYLSLARCLDEGALGRHRGLDLFEATGLRFGGPRGLPSGREVLFEAAREALAPLAASA